MTCYSHPCLGWPARDDEIVRLRTSNAVKRVTIEHRDWLVPYIDRLIEDISEIDQASTQWTLALLFGMLVPEMSVQQRRAAKKVMQRNLEHHEDWIVLNNTMKTLGAWAKDDAALKKWLQPQL